jgi:hypothetical protein
MIRTLTLCATVASISLSAQTAPAPGSSFSATGCIAEVQRDGSLGAKATGPQATPETAPFEANSPIPTDRYQLLDATPSAGTAPAAPAPGAASATPSAATPAQTAKTTYALRGQEKELANHVGHRVQISGTLLAPLAAKLPDKAKASAESVRTLQVTAVKMVGTDCSARPGAPR